MALLLTGFTPGIVGETVDLGTGIGTTIHDVVVLLSEIMGKESLLEFGSIPDRLYEYPQIADIARTITLINFHPEWSLREGLSKTVEWYRAQINNKLMEA
jgi:nucleoside-diphosphate-sugar epimerase